MGIKIGRGKSTQKLKGAPSAWEKFKQRKQENQPESLDDDSLSKPKTSKGKQGTSESNDLDDTFRPGSEWDDPTHGPGSKYDDPTHGQGSIWGGEPTFKTQNLPDPVQDLWLEGRTPNSGPLIAGGPLTWGSKVPGMLGRRDPAATALQDMVDANGKSKFGFIAGMAPKVNEKYFEVVDDGRAFKVRDGARPSDAIKDMINSESGQYGFECATAISVYAHIKAYKQYQADFGAAADTKFDQDFNGMQMGMWGRSTERLNLETDQARMGESPNLGEGYYFENNNVDVVGLRSGWRGENMVFAGTAAADGPPNAKGQPSFKRGEELFFAHPFGITNRAGVMERLVGESTRINPGAEAGLAAAAESAAGELRPRLTSLLEDFRAANQLRASNRDQVLRMQEEYDANPAANQHLVAPFDKAIGQDKDIDLVELAVAGRARDMLKEVEQELSRTSRFDRGRVLELRGLRDTLNDVITSEQHISGYKQAPYR